MEKEEAGEVAVDDAGEADDPPDVAAEQPSTSVPAAAAFAEESAFTFGAKVHEMYSPPPSDQSDGESDPFVTAEESAFAFITHIHPFTIQF